MEDIRIPSPSAILDLPPRPPRPPPPLTSPHMAARRLNNHVLPQSAPPSASPRKSPATHPAINPVTNKPKQSKSRNGTVSYQSYPKNQLDILYICLYIYIYNRDMLYMRSALTVSSFFNPQAATLARLSASNAMNPSRPVYSVRSGMCSVGGTKRNLNGGRLKKVTCRVNLLAR